MARLSIVTAETKILSEPRAALALAITAANVTKQALTKAVEAESRGDAMVREARQTWEEARERAEAAKGDLAMAMADAAGGGAAADRGPLLRARAAEAEAADMIDAARTAQSVLREQRVQAENAHGYKDGALRQAAGLVMQEGVEQWVLDILARQEALVRDRKTLRWIYTERIIPDRRSLVPLRDPVLLPGLETLLGDMGTIHSDRIAATAWRTAFEALQADAAAPLPGQAAE